MTPGTLLWTPAYRPAENLPQTGSQSLFTITGLVRVFFLVARVTTVLGASASVMKFVYNPTAAGASTDLCTAAAMSALAAGSWFYTTSFYSGVALQASDGGGSPQNVTRTSFVSLPPFLPAGILELNASGNQTGQAEYYTAWQAITPGSRLVVTP